MRSNIDGARPATVGYFPDFRAAGALVEPQHIVSAVVIEITDARDQAPSSKSAITVGS
jgi:hypothetical protein